MKNKANIKKKTLKGEIVSNREIAENYFVMEVREPYLGKNSFPGQFVMIRAQENVTDPLLRIPLGVHMITGTGISVLYKVVGAGTELLSRRKEGDRIDILGPLGNVFDLAPVLTATRPKVVIVSGGHGIAPLYALANAIRKEDPATEISFLIGACTEKEVLLEEDLNRIGVKAEISTDDGTRGHKGYVTELLKEQMPPAPDIVYACGPRLMLEELASVTKDAGIPAEVSLDAYMACGIGACLGCAIRTTDGYKMVCKDGPVFSAGEIIWEEAVAAEMPCSCD